MGITDCFKGYTCHATQEAHKSGHTHKAGDTQHAAQVTQQETHRMQQSIMNLQLDLQLATRDLLLGIQNTNRAAFL